MFGAFEAELWLYYPSNENCCHFEIHLENKTKILRLDGLTNMPQRLTLALSVRPYRLPPGKFLLQRSKDRNKKPLRLAPQGFFIDAIRV